MSQENNDHVSAVLKLFFLCQSRMQQTAMPDWQSLDLTMAQLKVLVTLGFDRDAALVCYVGCGIRVDVVRMGRGAD